ncbi:hypothetical protein T484DRAFT_1597933, partial [Baffinella frigidus]
PHDGLTSEQALVLLEKWGKNELTEIITPKWLIFLRLLTGPMPIMLWLAALIEFIIGSYADAGGILLGIQFLNAGISFYETNKAGSAVAALKASLKPLATVKRDGKWSDMDATLVVPGDMILLMYPPTQTLNPKPSTPTPQPRTLTPKPSPPNPHPHTLTPTPSTPNPQHHTLNTTPSTPNPTRNPHATFKPATPNPSRNPKPETRNPKLKSSTPTPKPQPQPPKRRARIMIILVTLSFTLCTTALIYLIVHGKYQNSLLSAERQSLSFAVVVLVASIPLAIEIVTTTTLALGSHQLSAHGAIVTRLGAIEEMAGMDMLCSDKTGTLTMNKMVIQDDCPTYTPGETYESVLFQAALAAKWKEPPRDALDTMVLKTSGQDLSKCDAYEQLDFTPFDPRVKRTEGKLKGPDGNVFFITKGAPSVVLELCYNK